MECFALPGRLRGVATYISAGVEAGTAVIFSFGQNKS